MARASRLFLGCWLASIAACDREGPVEAGSPAAAAAEQPSAEVAAAGAAGEGDAASNPRTATSQQAQAHEGKPPELAPPADVKTLDATSRTHAHGTPPDPLRPSTGDPTARTPSTPSSPTSSSTSSTTPADSALMSVEPPSPTLLILPAPPVAYTLETPAPITQAPQPTLVQRSAKRNAIIDEDKWFERNGLELPLYDSPPRPFPGGHPFARLRPPPGAKPLPAPGLAPAPPPPPRNPLPPGVPTELSGGHIVKAIRGTDCSIAIYPVGSFDEHAVVVRDTTGKLLGAFDFSAYAHVPGDTGHSRQDVWWAQAQDGVLFVSTFHLGYATDSGGLNAFITAIDIATGTLLWRSDPLVSNSRNFLLRDGWIITGYGFTAEPDFLFVLDGKTGEIVQRMKVKSGPETILEKDGVIYVRTYDRDYELVAKTK